MGKEFSEVADGFEKASKEVCLSATEKDSETSDGPVESLTSDSDTKNHNNGDASNGLSSDASSDEGSESDSSNIENAFGDVSDDVCLPSDDNLSIPETAGSPTVSLPPENDGDELSFSDPKLAEVAEKIEDSPNAHVSSEAISTASQQPPEEADVIDDGNLPPETPVGDEIQPDPVGQVLPDNNIENAFGDASDDVCLPSDDNLSIPETTGSPTVSLPPEKDGDELSFSDPKLAEVAEKIEDSPNAHVSSEAISTASQQPPEEADVIDDGDLPPETSVGDEQNSLETEDSPAASSAPQNDSDEIPPETSVGDEIQPNPIEQVLPDDNIENAFGDVSDDVCLPSGDEQNTIETVDSPAIPLPSGNIDNELHFNDEDLAKIAEDSDSNPMNSVSSNSIISASEAVDMQSIAALEAYRNAAKIEVTEPLTEMISDEAQEHILDGDGKTSGGHRWGTGIPGKSEFPSSWNDDKILNNIRQIVLDPSSDKELGRYGRTECSGIIDGVAMKVVIDSDQNVITAYPTNVKRNP